MTPSAESHCCTATVHVLPPPFTKKWRQVHLLFSNCQKAIHPVCFLWKRKRCPEVFSVSKTYTQRKGRNVLLKWLSHCDLWQFQAAWRIKPRASCRLSWPTDGETKGALHIGWPLSAFVWSNLSKLKNMGDGKLKGTSTRLKDRSTAAC